MSDIIDNITVMFRTPIMEMFDKHELKRYDTEGMSRFYMKCKIKDISDDYMTGLRDILRLQYKLPIKYLKPVPGVFHYVAQKSLIIGNEKDINHASVVVEPINCDFVNAIQYTPINQSIPVGTIVTINESIPFDTLKDGSEPERKNLWSSNFRTIDDIENVIKNNITDKQCKRLKPWIMNCHIGAVDIGSQITGKFVVSMADTNIIKSLALFSFKRSDEDKEFVIWNWNAFNITPRTILTLLSEHKELGECGKKLVAEMLKKYPEDIKEYEE